MFSFRLRCWLFFQHVGNRHLRDGILHLVGRIDVVLLRCLVTLVSHQPLQHLGLQSRGVDRSEGPPEVMEAVNMARLRVFVLSGTGQVNPCRQLNPGKLHPESSRVMALREYQLTVADNPVDVLDHHGM